MSIATPSVPPPAPARRCSRHAGFTLLELIIVIAIIGIIAAIAVPQMRHVPRRAQEAALKMDLRTLRDVIDQHKGDTGRYPPSLEALVEQGYIRKVPEDPVTKSAETWVLIFEDDFGEGMTEVDYEEGAEPGIIDVRSGAEGETLDGTPYGEL